jgi:hypothetical protein
VHPLDHRAQRCDHRLQLVVKISGQLTKYALIATEPDWQDRESEDSTAFRGGIFWAVGGRLIAESHPGICHKYLMRSSIYTLWK